MAIVYQSGVFLLLAAISSAGPIVPNAGCTYRGKVYSNLDIIPHDNGCATQQCQFGQVVTYYEACGKDIDGNCHRLNMMFTFKGTVYECRKVTVGQNVEYRNEVAISLNSECVEGGTIYKPQDTFTRAGGCQVYQCQSGQSMPINEGCGETIDGKCHAVGELYVSKGKTYNCTAVDRNGAILFDHTELTTSRNTRPCSKDGQTYTDLQTFRLPGKCAVYQCQDRAIKTISLECTFKQAGNKCYSPGERWTFNNDTYDCVRDLQGPSKIVIAAKAISQCYRSERYLDFLDVMARDDGCNEIQCQASGTAPVAEGCFDKNAGQCQQLNSIWKEGSTTLKCIRLGDGGYRIYELDEFGNLIEKEVVTMPPPVFTETCPNLAADIIFVWDSSGSISRGNYAKQLEFSCSIASAFRIGRNDVQFGGVVFSDKAEKVFDLKDYTNYTDVCTRIKQTARMAGQTETQKAFQIILEEGMFLQEAGGRQNLSQIVIVITDGASSDTAKTVAAAGQLKALGVQMISVGVDKVSMTELSGIASRSENVFTIRNYNTIFSLRSQITERACDVPTDPPVIPEETIPPKCPDALVDIVFILDSSSGVGSENYEKKKNLAVNITNMFNVSPTSAQVGTVLISTQPKTEFNLNTYSDNNAVTKAILEAAHLKGEREVDDAIQSVISQGLYTPANGGRTKAARVAILMIDGSPTDWANTLPTAKKLRNEGVRVITIGVGTIPMKKLTGLSGTSENVFASPSYELLRYTKELMYTRICEVSKLPRPDPEPPRCTDTEVPPCDHTCYNTLTGLTCECNTGFVVNKQNSSKCDDVNECLKQTNCQQICENTVGSYVCRCKPGYVVNAEDLEKCDDVDECKSNPCQASCTNTEGSYTCTCNEGYRVSPTDPAVCIDIDECKESSPCQHTCTNTEGSYDCSCNPGFVVDSNDPTKCKDIDECKESSPCQHICINTEGSYVCSCNPGFVVDSNDPTKCKDIDECKESSPCQHTCTNKEGSYDCFCNPGFVVDSNDPTKCKDIDECKESSPCQHTCTNTEGSYDCSCNPGFVVDSNDPTKCKDIDECTESSPCQHQCKNTEGSYTCSCYVGFVVSSTDPTECDDIDECKESSPCQHTCTNTKGSYDCSCNPGFVVDSDDPTKCKDIDECKDLAPCQHRCTNSQGSYHCSCEPGFVVDSTDPDKCTDVDECEKDRPCQQTCTNTQGSYGCSCEAGYGINKEDPSKCDSLDHCKMLNPCEQICDNDEDTYICSCQKGFVVNPNDPTKCIDINECKHEPCEQKCTNTPGSYLCSCITGYVISKEDPSKCTEIDECKREPCEQICKNTPGGFNCSCQAGYLVDPSDPTKCIDENECLDLVNPPCHHSCTNTEGSYSCSCRLGYVPNACDPNTCKDINECEQGLCENKCTNTRGGYICY